MFRLTVSINRGVMIISAEFIRNPVWADNKKKFRLGNSEREKR